jgi:hypothetical protein
VNTPVDALKPAASLQRQIDQAARHLAASRRSAGTRRAALGRRLKASLTSPGMFLFAVAGGYLVAELTQNTGAADPPKASAPVARIKATNTNLILRIALHLVGWLHAATASPPYVRRPPSGTPEADGP